MVYDLNPVDVKNYLIKKNWVVEEYNQYLYKAKKESNGEIFETLIPMNEKDFDYKYRITDLVKFLSLIDERNEEEVLNEIENPNSDLFKVTEGQRQSWITTQLILTCPHCRKQTRLKLALEGDEK